MARRLALAVAAIVLMVQSALLAFASRTSPAEAFWRAALPAAPMPDAVLELLHHETNVPNGMIKDDDDDPPSPVPPFTFSYGDYKALPGRSKAVAAPSSRLLNRGNRPATEDDAVVGSSTVFFLEDAVRVGGSLPFHGSPPVATAAAKAPAPSAPPRLYTVRAVRAVEGSSFVICRGEAGAAYGCRATGSARAYVVDLAGGERGDDAAPMTAAAVCHTDTSRWDPQHAAFRLLGVKPGDAAVCHAVPNAQVLPAKNDMGTMA